MALQYVEAQRQARPDLADWYASLADLYQRKLWHQLTLKLDQFLALAVVQAGDALIQLYNHFISDFETKINLLKFAHFTVVVSRQYLDKDAGINYLEGVISKLRSFGRQGPGSARRRGRAQGPLPTENATAQERGNDSTGLFAKAPHRGGATASLTSARTALSLPIS
jgi:hypothetical protein